MKKHIPLIVLFVLGLGLSAIKPHDYFTWLLEVFPAVLGFIALTFTYKRFQFTYFTYIMILLHCYVLLIGGHYTYAEVPAFEWIKDTFHQSRNNYDKVGHFFQGSVPAIIVRELFIRLKIMEKRTWLAFLTVCVCCTISVFMSFWSGECRSLQVRPAIRFSARKATFGIRSLICF